jgi:hypothetical protein
LCSTRPHYRNPTKTREPCRRIGRPMQFSRMRSCGARAARAQNGVRRASGGGRAGPPDIVDGSIIEIVAQRPFLQAVIRNTGLGGMLHRVRFRDPAVRLLHFAWYKTGAVGALKSSRAAESARPAGGAMVGLALVAVDEVHDVSRHRDRTCVDGTLDVNERDGAEAPHTMLILGHERLRIGKPLENLNLRLPVALAQIAQQIPEQLLLGRARMIAPTPVCNFVEGRWSR